MIEDLSIFLGSLLIGLIIGMFRMSFHFSRKNKRRMDCMTCLHFDRWSDSCPFCHYVYDKHTDCNQRMKAGEIEK